VERAQADPVPGAGALQQLEQRQQGGLRLHIDVPAHLGEGLQQLLEERHRLGARHPRLCHVPPGQVGDAARAVGHPVQRLVVEGDQPPVAGGVHIGLDVPVARRHGPAELPHGVLQAVRRPAAVGEGDRGRMVEVGVARRAYRRGHRRSIARSGRPAATTVLPSGPAGTANRRRNTWASGPIASAYSSVPTPTVPPSTKPVATTLISMTVRTRRTDSPVRWCSPVISPSRGPGPKRAAMYRPVAAPFSTTPATMNATRAGRPSASGTTTSVASIAAPITSTLETVPRPGR